MEKPVSVPIMVLGAADVAALYNDPDDAIGVLTNENLDPGVAIERALEHLRSFKALLDNFHLGEKSVEATVLVDTDRL